MSKCSECRKNEALDTWKDKVADWIVHHIFPKTNQNERNAAFSQGFNDGYTYGRKHQREVNSMLKLYSEYDDIPRA